MKRLFAVILVLVLLLPAYGIAAFYAPALGMTMDEFIAKYNAVQAPLDSPYDALIIPKKWTDYYPYYYAWFYPEKGSSVVILLVTEDHSHRKSTESGLDRVQIYIPDEKDFIAFLSVTARCADVFCVDYGGETLCEYVIGKLLRLYHDEQGETKSLIYFLPLNPDENICLNFFYNDGYYIEIAKGDN